MTNEFRDNQPPCPKCGGKVCGPKYDTDVFLKTEWLIYNCMTCGYRYHTKCKERGEHDYI